MTTKKRRVIIISKEADKKLLTEQKRLKSLAKEGKKDIKVSHVVESMISAYHPSNW